MERVFPTWVSEDETGTKTLTIPPDQMFAIIVEAFRAQQVEIDDLKKDREARRPVVSFNPNLGLAAMGMFIGSAVLINGRRKRGDEKRS